MFYVLFPMFVLGLGINSDKSFTFEVDSASLECVEFDEFHSYGNSGEHNRSACFLFTRHGGKVTRLPQI